MSYEQLRGVFPDGKTVHLASNGRALPRYEEAPPPEIAARWRRHKRCPAPAVNFSSLAVRSTTIATKRKTPKSFARRHPKP